MRILSIYKTALPESVGGVETLIDQLARRSGKFGIESEVLCLASQYVEPTIEFNGYLLHRAKLNFQIASTGFSLPAITRFNQLVGKFDLIHYHFPWPFMDVMHFLKKIKKPSVLTYHSDIVRQKYLLKLYNPLKKKFLEDVDRIVVTSPNYLESSVDLIPYKHKVSVIPIGIDRDVYPKLSLEKLNYWHHKLGARFFLFIGVFRYYKGVHTLLEAAQEVDYPIVLLGSGGLQSELEQKAMQLGLRNVYFLGYLPDEDKAALLTLCYAVILPSHLRSEAFGISLLEGAMYSKPMISCEIGTGTSFINIHNKTGFVVNPNDPAALRQAMRDLWENPEMALEMGRNAGERYQDFFTADKMVDSYIGLYQDIIKNWQD